MDLDVTFLVQFALLTFLLLSLNGILFKPLLGVLDARQHKVVGLKDEVERLTIASDADIEAYQTRLREARDIAQREREALRSSGREDERKLLGETRNEITKSIGEARDRTTKAENEARSALAPQLDQLAKQMVQKILGREVAG